MFEKKIGIIYLTKSKIFYCPDNKAPYKLTETIWDGADLTTYFKKIKAVDKLDSIKIILGDDLTYVLLTKVPTVNLDKTNMIKSMRGLTPEEITETNFDFRVLSKIGSASTSFAQIYVVPQKILTLISSAAKLAKLSIYFIHPVSLLLAAATKTFTSPHLILCSRLEKLGIVSYQGIVYISEIVAGSLDFTVNNLIEYVKTSFGIKVDTVLLDWNTELSQPILANEKNLTIKKIILDPIILALNKKRGGKEDKEILDIKPLENPDTTSVPLSSTLNGDSNSLSTQIMSDQNNILRNYNPLIIIIILIFTIIVGAVIFLLI